MSNFIRPFTAIVFIILIVIFVMQSFINDKKQQEEFQARHEYFEENFMETCTTNMLGRYDSPVACKCFFDQIDQLYTLDENEWILDEYKEAMDEYSFEGLPTSYYDYWEKSRNYCGL